MKNGKKKEFLDS